MEQAQISNATHLFREVDVLLAARKVLQGKQHLNILSFGCSVGDEVATLRCIFPEATIYGCDIEPGVLGVAAATTGHLAGIFLSSEEGIRSRGPFDLICAFSVLCLNPMPKPSVMQASFPFSRFDEMTGLLADVLAPGGLLALRNSSYLLSETACFASLDICRVSTIYRSGTLPILRRDHSIALELVKSGAAPVYRCRNVEGLTDWDFVDCLFRKREAKASPRMLSYEFTTLPVPAGATPVASWSRSNLDYLLPGTDPVGLIEWRHDYTMFALEGSEDRGMMETTIQRRPIDQGPMRSFGPSRSWLAV